MLKIAEYNTITGEKVELKELEKFGFMKYIKHGYFKNLSDGTNILIDYDGKNWVINLDINLNEIEKGNNIFNEFDAIFDLIQAGLVEKVEE